MRMSEALGNAGAEGKTLNFTETDRSRVQGQNRGGVGFSGLQHFSKPHKKANTVWGFGNTGVAEKKIRQNDPENSLWTTFVGSPDQHKSNSVVIGDAIKEFQKSVKQGVVPVEQIMLMNKRLNELTDLKTGAKVFQNGFDLTDPSALSVANTFARRAAVGDVMLGLGVKGPMARKDFKNEFPVIVTKTLVSTIAKAVAAYAVNKAASQQDALVGLFAKIGTAVAQAAVNIADTRSWTTLPKEFQVACIPTPADRKLTLSASGGVPVEVNLLDGTVNMVYAKSILATSPLLVNQFKLK